MTKIPGMAKVLALALIFVLMSLTTGLEVKAVDDGTLPNQGTILPPERQCYVQGGVQCIGEIEETRIGNKVFQEVSFTALFAYTLGERVFIEVNGITYPQDNMGSIFAIETDKVTTAFFKIVDASGNVVETFDWIKLPSVTGRCVTTSYETQMYFLIAPGVTLEYTDGRTVDVKNFIHIDTVANDVWEQLYRVQPYDTETNEPVGCETLSELQEPLKQQIFTINLPTVSN